MSLATPGDYDEEQSGTTNDETPGTEQSTGERANPSQKEPDSNSINGPSTEELQRAVETNLSALKTKAESEAVRNLVIRVNELQSELTELQRNYQGLHDYTLELEKRRGDWLDTTDENAKLVAQLSAAVFDDNPECPECGSGHLTSGELWLRERLVCSDDDCSFEQQVAVF